MLSAISLDTQKPILATKTGQRARCPDPLCNCIMMSRCSDDKDYTNHWFGHHNGTCVSHYEPMSEWHLAWQNQINNPQCGENIEVIVNGKDRYKRADIKPPHGIVIEVQKSPITYNEVKTREKHYKNMIWLLHLERTDIKMEYAFSKEVGTDIKTYKPIPKKAWQKDRNESIPIFIDCGSYLFCDGLIQKRIPKQEFISKYINGEYINYKELGMNYWNNISNTFSFYNSIIPRIVAEERLTILQREKKAREERLQYIQLQNELALKKKMDALYREQAIEEERKQLYQQTKAAFGFFEKNILYQITCYNQFQKHTARIESERLHYCDPQYQQEIINEFQKINYDHEIATATIHKANVEKALDIRLEFENWKQIIKRNGMDSLINTDPTPEIKARFKHIEILEQRLKEFEQKNIPTFKTETEILKLKREISNLSRVKS